MDFRASKIQKGGISVITTVAKANSLVTAMGANLSPVDLSTPGKTYSGIMNAVRFASNGLGGADVPVEISLIFI